MTQLKLSGAAGKTQKTGRLLCCEGATETDDCQEERGKLSIRPYIRPSIHPSVRPSILSILSILSIYVLTLSVVSL